MSEEEEKTLIQVDETSLENQVKNCLKEECVMVDVDRLKDNEEKYKSLLVVNESEDADVTLRIYSERSPVCHYFRNNRAKTKLFSS